jgi:hypothetical protein
VHPVDVGRNRNQEELTMIRQNVVFASLAISFALSLSSPASALTMQECSTKYQAAQKAGTLKGMKWNDFRKAECGADAKPAAAKATGTPATSTSTAVFPAKIDPKYAKESPGKARMKTCTDQYNANKAKNANGGLKWIVKGGGYWSECNKRLKG